MCSWYIRFTNLDFILWATEGSLSQKYKENTVVTAEMMVRACLGLTTNVVPSRTNAYRVLLEE